MSEHRTTELGVTELPPPHEVNPTRNDIDTESVGLVTLDTRSNAITSCNDAFAEVVGRAAADLLGCEVADFIGPEVRSLATAVIDGVRAGFISSVDGNVDVLGRAGSRFVGCRILAIGTGPPHEMALASVTPSDAPESPQAASSEIGVGTPHTDANQIVLATLDDEWRISELAPGSAGQLGLPEPNSTAVLPQLHELAHPADAATVLTRFGRHTDAPETFTVRLRGPNEQWLSACATVSPLRGHIPPKFGLVVRLLQPAEIGDAQSERVARLEERLARIREVVQAADESTATKQVDLAELTGRQREIVERLLKGHRVDAIARDLYVSASTVRNHLSAIFEKLGVASQSELIELLRDPSTSARPGIDPGSF